MPIRGRKFITEFLVPSLDEQRFGPRLMWLDIEKKVFQMQWNHKSSSDWTTSDAAVFAAWDKRKGNYMPDDREYYSKSKQRFRAALYKYIKHKHITELHSAYKYTKIYCIGDGKNISATYITAQNETGNYGNENLSQKVKQNAEDVIFNLKNTWNAYLLNELQENSLEAVHIHETRDDFNKEEQVVTDCNDEFIPDLHYENYIPSLDDTSDNKKNASTKETLNEMLESDMKLFHTSSETNIIKKDNLPKRVMTIANNFHDYLHTSNNRSRQMEWNDHEFFGTDENFPLSAYI